MAQTFSVVLDRFEEDWAVLVCDSRELGHVLFPRQILQGIAQEGDVLKIEITKDDEETARRRSKVEILLDKLARKNPRQ